MSKNFHVCVDGWVKKQLGEICQIEIGGTPSRSNSSFWANNEEGYPWVAISDLRSKWVDSTSEKITHLGVANSNVKFIPKGTVLMSFKLTLGRVGIAATDLYTNEAIAAFFPKSSELVSGWLYHALPSIAKGGNAEQAIKGQTLNKEKLKTLYVQLPSTLEQQRIAEILDTLDETIAHTTAIIAKLKQIKAGLLHDLLTRGLDENGELRNAIAHPEQFKDSPLGRIPKDWEVVKLESVLNGRPKNGYSPKEVDEWTGTLMLGLSCLTEEGFEPCQLKNAPLKDPKVSNAILHDGDFLLSRSNTRERVALAGIYRDIGVPCIYPDLMMRLSVYEKTNPRFLELLLQHFPVRRQLTSNAQGTSGSMVKIGSQTVIGVVIALPDPVEQVSIIHGIDQHDTRIREEEAYLEKLKLHKKGLMHDLLTGKVRVNQINTSASLSVKAERS